MSSPIPVFTVRETHGRAFRSGNRLIAHSQDVGWRSLHAAVIEEGPFHATETAISHPSLIYHLTRPTEVTRRIEGTKGEKALIGPRRICLTPGDANTSWHHSGHPEILQVYLRRSIYEGAVSEIYARAPVSLNVLNAETLDGANMRTFEIPGSGGVMLARYSSEQDEIFPEGEAAAYYRSPREIDDKIDELLADAGLRARVRRSAIRLAADQTYDMRAATVLRECGLTAPSAIAPRSFTV